MPRLVLFACWSASRRWRSACRRRSRARARRRRSRRGAGGGCSARRCRRGRRRAGALAELWNLIRGAAPSRRRRARELGRRYIELLTENLGQPGSASCCVAVHDMDARRDLVFALLGAARIAAAILRRVPGATAERGRRAAPRRSISPASARDHAARRARRGAGVPIATEPHLAVVLAGRPWRGETHRLCDRPGSLTRLLEEVAAAGAEQVILVSASPPPARPHELSAGRGRPARPRRRTAGAFEAADAARRARAVRPAASPASSSSGPAHNPLGPLDFAGVYDERSDRRTALGELSIAATRTPTASSSSRWSAPAASASRRSNPELAAPARRREV